jgi:hypothetical protein
MEKQYKVSSGTIFTDLGQFGTGCQNVVICKLNQQISNFFMWTKG